MMAFRASAFGERWLLATPREASLWASRGMKPSTDTMAFIAIVDIVALGEALGYRGARFELRRIVEEHLRRGTLRLLRETRPRRKLDPVREPPPTPYEPIPDNDPILDDPRTLRILQCDPLLTRDQPLRFTFMIRGLVGRSTTLRITDKTGTLVHERPLEPGETSDGAHERAWDGCVTVGPSSGKRIAPGAGPCTLELVHDARLRDQATFSLLEPLVVIIEFGGFSFASGRELLMPDVVPLARDEAGPARVPGLVAAAAVLRFAVRNPAKHSFVAGHADTVGKATDNLALSRERARNVQLYLAGDAQGWAAHCQQWHDVEDIQRILAWVSQSFGEYDCDPGPIDGKLGPKTKAARAAFREQFTGTTGRTMPEASGQTHDDWLAYFELYERRVGDLLVGDGLELAPARAALRFTAPASAGFGEQYPSDRPGVDNLDSERNRRVEVVFLDPSEAELAADPSGTALYGREAGVLRRYIPLAFEVAETEIAFRLVDRADSPLRDVLVELVTPTGELRRDRTNAEGEIVFRSVPRGTCKLRLPEKDASAWDSTPIAPRPLPDAPETFDPESLDLPEVEAGHVGMPCDRD